jgi:hypothetical protein
MKIWIGRDMFVTRRDCLLRSGSRQLSPVIQVAVIPFEIDVPRHVNLDDRTLPRLPPRFGIPDVVFEQLDVIFANGRCKQLAESRARDSL